MIENPPVQNAKGIREKKMGRIMVVIAALGVAVVVHSFISLEMQHMKIKSRRAAAIVNGTSRLGSDGKVRALGWLGMGSDKKRKGQSQSGVTSTPSPLNRKPVIIAPSQVRKPLSCRRFSGITPAANPCASWAWVVLTWKLLLPLCLNVGRRPWWGQGGNGAGRVRDSTEHGRQESGRSCALPGE